MVGATNVKTPLGFEQSSRERSIDDGGDRGKIDVHQLPRVFLIESIHPPVASAKPVIPELLVRRPALSKCGIAAHEHRAVVVIRRNVAVNLEQIAVDEVNRRVERYDGDPLIGRRRSDGAA